MPPQVSRLIAIFTLIIAVFLATRWWASPPSFGEFGHYRGDALATATQKSPHYVPRASCAECHDTEAAENAAGPHKKVNCQTCHGPGVEHIDDPQTTNIRRPDVIKTCLRCHEERAARPAKFPQIDFKDHADGAACNTCHVVHNPLDLIDDEGEENEKHE